MPSSARDFYLRLIRGETYGPGASLARLALQAASLGYGLAVRYRNLAYQNGWKPSVRASVPVVSVGNITLGGTGKTPMVEYLARFYRDAGARVALLSRGYGQSTGLNDEGLVLDQNLPDVPHLQDPDRASLARIAVEELETQLLILDDGFQHRRLARDLDIVLLDALDPFGTGRLFPRGLLREPISSLKRARIVVLSRADLIDPPSRASIRARAENAAGPLLWVEARHAPHSLVDTQGRPEPLSNLSSLRIAAFCGIGNPEGFRRTLESLQITPIDFRAFPDHHPYTRSDVDALLLWTSETRPDLVLTTQKDSVKLRLDSLGPVPLRALRIGLEPLEGRDRLESALRALWPPRV